MLSMNYNYIGRIIMNIENFYEIDENLQNLDEQIKDSIIELGFSIRESGESICLVLNSFDAFSMLVGKVPEKITNDYLEQKSTKFYIELDSLNTDKVRMYTNMRNMSIELMGYYVNDGIIYETKVYEYTDDITSNIKRYDSNLNLIDDSEFDTVVNLDEWTGSQRIIDIAIENNYSIKCIKKNIKNQVYLLVKDNKVL